MNIFFFSNRKINLKEAGVRLRTEPEKQPEDKSKVTFPTK